MQKPFFSLIIPTLNEAKYLSLLLSDLLVQSFPNFEVIIVDGHSEDNTLKLTQKYLASLPSLTLLSSHKRHVCVQRNLGAKSARGDYFIFLDADTRLPPYFLSGIKYQLEKNSADILTTRFQPDKKTPINLAVTNACNLFLEIQNNYKPAYLLEAMVVVNKNCFNKIGGFNESVSYSEGKSFIASALKHGFHSRFCHDPVWTYSFRRFRKFGLMSLAARTAKLELYELFGLDPKHHKFQTLYPMEGGKFFDEPTRTKLFIKLKNRLNSSRSRQQFLSKLETILQYLKN